MVLRWSTRGLAAAGAMLLVAPLAPLLAQGTPGTSPLATAQGVKVDGSLLKPQVATYAFSVQGNPMGNLTVTIAKESDLWVARQEMTSSMVNQKSEIRMKATDLAPLSVSQTSTAGPMTLTSELKLEQGKVTGTAALPPQMGGTKAFDTIVPEGTLLPGADEFALMVSPLEVGKTIVFPVFSIRSGAVENSSYKVAALEAITVPAGKFDAYRVELGGDQPRTEWLLKELPHVLLKQEMSGMPVSVELQSLK